MNEHDTTQFIWSLFLISSCVIIILLPLALILCARCEFWKNRYELEAKPEKRSKRRISNKSNKSNNSLKLFNITFKRYSLDGTPKVEDECGVQYNQFTSDTLPMYKECFYSTENDDVVKSSERCLNNLKTDHTDLSTEDCTDICEMRSCISKMSRNSFYSTYSKDEKQVLQEPSVDVIQHPTNIM